MYFKFRCRYQAYRDQWQKAVPMFIIKGFGFGFGLGFTETFGFRFRFRRNPKMGFVRSLDKNTLKTDVYIGITSMQKEEVFVLTLQDLIGSVGGSLGLFFGFSFSAVFFHCLNKIF